MPDYLQLVSGDRLALIGDGLLLLAVQSGVEELYGRKVVPLAAAVTDAGTNPTVEALSVSVSLVDVDGALEEPDAVTCSIYNLGGTLVRSVAGTINGAIVSFTVLTSDFDTFDSVLVRFTVGSDTYPTSGYLHVINPG